MSKQIIQAIIKYAKENETDYAILLNGEWGSGKTFLWKNEIKPQIEKIDFKPIYVSLYGVTEIQEIGKMILLSSLNISEKYTKGKIPELLKSAINLINSVGSVLSKSISKDKLFQVKLEDLVNLDNKIICFDDLERVNLDITDVFGFINGLVEHDKAKVVILADEKKVSEKFQYSRIEEKTISALHYMVYQKTQNKKTVAKKKLMPMIASLQVFLISLGNFMIKLMNIRILRKS